MALPHRCSEPMNFTFKIGLLFLVLFAPGAAAEPYLAVREGHKCVVCHVNPSGGGMRSAFGSFYGMSTLPASAADATALGEWADLAQGRLALGANYRTTASYVDVPEADGQSAFSSQDLRAYLAANVVRDRLLLYVDQSLTPTALNREAYARLWSGSWYLKAGRMYLPYGLRLQDDSAFIRRVPGINFTAPDNGVEAGFESGAWSTQLAVSNGSGGGPEQDTGKQESLRIEYVRPDWRLGASANFNDSSAGQRRMANVFGGLRTGSVAWLAEADYIVDDGFATGERRLLTGLLEGNWGFARGHNLKVTGEFFDPDMALAEDEQTRHSLLWEYTPISFLQLRVGGRWSDGIPQNALQNQRQALVELHAFF
jgi:hypothetical protein